MKKTILNMVLIGAGLLATVSNATAASNKQLNIGITQEFENLNPIIAQMAASTYMYYMVGHPLVTINTAWQWECKLCVKLPTLENGGAHIVDEKGTKVLYVDWEINPKASWGDGKPVTGEDVKLSWQIGGDSAVSVGDKDVYQKIVAIDIDKKNPKKFTMKFKEPRYDYFQLGTLYIVPKHIEGDVYAKSKGQAGAYEKQSTYNTNPTNPGLYSGPYVVKEIKLGSHVILERNPHYYGNKPAIEKIVFKLIPDTKTLEANLLSGTIDMISELGMSFDQALAFDKRAQRDAALKAKFLTIFEDGMTYEHIDMNLRNEYLKDIRVRQALIHAVDRDKLSTALFEGRQKKALSNIHPKDEYYTDKVVQYDYDPAKSIKLLEEAGFKKGPSNYFEKDGKKLSFSLMTTAQNKTRELVQVFLQEQWKKIGIDISLENQPARVFFGETVRKARYNDMAMYAWISSPDNPPRSTLHSSQIPTKANGYNGQNSGGWSDPKVDALLDAILKEFAVKKRIEIMHQVQYEYTKQLPVLPLYMRAEIAVVPTTLKGFKITGHQFYSTLSVDQWNIADSNQGH
jgi:peptide/nickel transport system substrate-binding protein